MASQLVPDPTGYTTVLTVTNVSKDAQIIHITVWAADSTPCLDFNEVLTGYDVWQIFFRDMISGSFGAFDTNRADNQGPNGGVRSPFEWGPDGRSAYNGLNKATVLPTPQKTTIFSGDANCYMPYGNNVDVASNINCLRAPLFQRTHGGCTWTINNVTTSLKVRGGFDNDWLKQIPADKNATDPIWFYVTVDVVTACNFDFPSTLNYFAKGGNYKPVNVLIGDIVYLDQKNNYSEAISAVHIESDPDVLAANWNLFYEEKVQGGKDLLSLEPLATAFAFNYYNMGQIKSNVILWKNHSDFLAKTGEVDDCGYYLYYNWDFDEHTNSRSGSCRVSPCSPNDIDPNEFPFETQSVPLSKDNFDLVDVAGWMLIVFPPSYPIGIDDPTPNINHPVADLMGWVGVKINYVTQFSNYSAAIEAATMANAHCFPGQILTPLGVNFDYDPPTE